MPNEVTLISSVHLNLHRVSGNAQWSIELPETELNNGSLNVIDHDDPFVEQVPELNGDAL